MKGYLNKFKLFFCTLLIGVAVLLPHFSVHATENPYILLDSGSGVSYVIDEVNLESKKIGKFKLLRKVDRDDGVRVLFNREDYNKLSTADKQELMGKTLNSIEKSSMVAKERTRLYNFIAQSDTATSAVVRQLSTDVTADYARAWSWFAPFSGFVSTVLGFMAIIIVVLLGLTTVIDLAFLGIPPLQVMLLPSGGGKPKFVSNEAYSVYKKSVDNSSKYVNTAWEYLLCRGKYMIALGICVAYLLNGQIFYAVGWFIDSVGAVFNK